MSCPYRSWNVWRAAASAEAHARIRSWTSSGSVRRRMASPAGQLPRGPPSVCRLAPEMPAQPVERALPAVRGGGFLVRRAPGAVESVLRPGVADDLVRHRGLARQRFAQLLDVGDRDAGVLVAKEAQPGRGEPCGVADQRLEERHPLGHDATPVEPDGGPELASR